MHPLAKTVGSLLATKAKDHILPALTQAPQFAYLPFRGTSDCLLRVFEHCRLIRQLTRSHHVGTFQRYLGQTNLGMIGGIQISLDLSKAFDRVSRPLLIQCLQHLDLPKNIADPLIAWLGTSKFVLSHKGHEHSFTASRGLRQGSTEAPFCWTVITLYLCQRLRAHFDSDWIRQCLTIFADDIHAHWTFHSPSEFRECIKKIGLLLDVIASIGLSVNFEKSAILLKTTGTTSAQTLSKHIVRQKRGPVLKLVGRDGKQVFVPVVASHDYLGCVISYDRFEDHTLNRRLTHANTLMHQLKPILADSRHHRVADRLKLFDVGVMTSLNYGTSIAGLTHKGAQQYHAFVLKCLRHIARSPRHITRESNSNLVARIGRKLPLEEFAVVSQRHSENLCNRKGHLPYTDVVHSIPSFPILNLDLNLGLDQDSVDHLVDVQPETSLAPPQQFACQTCSRSFQDLTALKIHCTKLKHILPNQYDTKRQFQVAADALEGLTQCRHCCEPFQSWKGLEAHIELGRCRASQHATQGIVTCPVVSRASIVAQIKQEAFSDLMAEVPLLNEMCHNCVICGRWNADSMSLTHHLRKQHAEVAQSAQAHQSWMRGIANMGSGRGTCTLCHATLTNLGRHKCPVLNQFCVLHQCLNVQTDYQIPLQVPVASSAGSLGDKKTFVCETCGAKCKSALGLKQHSQRSTTCQTLQKQNAKFECQYCQLKYSTPQNLKKHIKRSHPDMPTQSTAVDLSYPTLDRFFNRRTPQQPAQLTKAIVWPLLSQPAPSPVDGDLRHFPNICTKWGHLYKHLRSQLPCDPGLHVLLAKPPAPPLHFVLEYSAFRPLETLDNFTKVFAPTSWAILIQELLRIMVHEDSLASTRASSREPWLETCVTRALKLASPHEFFRRRRRLADGRYVARLSGNDLISVWEKGFAGRLQCQTQIKSTQWSSSPRLAAYVADRAVPACASPRATITSACHRHQLHVLPGPEPRVHRGGLSRQLVAMEKRFPGRKDDNAASKSLDDLDVHRASTTCSPCSSGNRNPASSQKAQGPEVSDGRGTLDLREVEFQDEPAGALRRCRSSTAATRNGASEDLGQLETPVGYPLSSLAQHPQSHLHGHSVEGGHFAAPRAWQCAPRTSPHLGTAQCDTAYPFEDQAVHRSASTSSPQGVQPPTSERERARERCINILTRLQTSALLNSRFWCWLNSLFQSFSHAFAFWGREQLEDSAHIPPILNTFFELQSWPSYWFTKPCKSQLVWTGHASC